MKTPEFDDFAHSYRDEHINNIKKYGGEVDYFHMYKVEDVAKELSRQQPPRTILDFGGGIGSSINSFREFFPSSDLVLLDPSEKSLEVAQQWNPGAATFQHFDGATIPFPERSFDVTFAACVFHHIEHPQHVDVIREIARCLTPGGSLFVFEHNPYNPVTRRIVRDCPFDRDAVLIPASTMAQRIAAGGLSIRTISFRVFFPHALRRLRPLERHLRRLPLGGQYFVHAVKMD